ncbi:MAG: dTDP-4-dehydrorhamnose 3,5-epimerase [Phycisphaerales bacterium]|nr:dTDP-4-dehydrorhamnose 3,5-epimerase [Hyphomonadaceae bacterium]
MIERLAIPEVWTYTPRRFEDERGWFSETFNAGSLAEALAGLSFVQDNQALTRAKGTLRGMHFQKPPKAQDKFVRVLRGAVLDVAVDIRPGSPTYGKWVAEELSAENRRQIFVPKGFAHGYLTLEPDTEVFYKVSDYYSRDHEGGIAWDDPAIGVDWRMPADAVLMAERDRQFPRLADLEPVFQTRPA